MRWRKGSPRSRCWSDSVRRRRGGSQPRFFRYGLCLRYGRSGRFSEHGRTIGNGRPSVRTPAGPAAFSSVRFRVSFAVRSVRDACPRSGFRKRGRPTSLPLPERMRARSVRSRREGRWPSFVSAVLSPFCFGSWEHEPKTRRCRNRSRFRRRWHRSRNRRKTMPEESERRGLVCSGSGLGSVPRFRMRRADRVLREREIGKEDRARR